MDCGIFSSSSMETWEILTNSSGLLLDFVTTKGAITERERIRRKFDPRRPRSLGRKSSGDAGSADGAMNFWNFVSLFQ